MTYALDDTIAAIATAPGGGARGVVRMSGPDAVRLLAESFESHDRQSSPAAVDRPTRLKGSVQVGRSDGLAMNVPGEAFVWPTTRSYTREPAVEFHTLGSRPLLSAVLEEFHRAGARPAAPGEFTLRAFLAGRLDLTQAEAVLGVIDAQERDDLDAALDQLAGGLSKPLVRLRTDLLDALAQLEAGLDFVEEDIEFVSRENLRRRLLAAERVVTATREQIAARDRRVEVPRVAILGPPNAGKSSLFNALAARFAEPGVATAIVSTQPGTTRDYVALGLEIDGVACELIDTAGEDSSAGDRMHTAAQLATAGHRRRADVRLQCGEWSASRAANFRPENSNENGDIHVFTKLDLADEPVGAANVACSSFTGEGIDDLAALIRRRVASLHGDGSRSASAATAARCSGVLERALSSLATAIVLLDSGGDELIAAEIRAVLDGLGEVVGAVCADDVLDRIFSQFCIGK